MAAAAVGIAPPLHGQDIGTALVLRVSQLLSQAGIPVCHVGWTTRESFYRRRGAGSAQSVACPVLREAARMELRLRRSCDGTVFVATVRRCAFAVSSRGMCPHGDVRAATMAVRAMVAW